MVLPNFLIVGAMKAGTSWLAEMLNELDDVYIAEREVHYFNVARNYERGVEWYEEWFAEAVGCRAIGEKTAGYLLGRDFLPTIAADLPDAKIIVVLRNPVARAVSQINHHVRYGDVAPPSGEHWLATEDFARFDERYAVLERGDYVDQLTRLFDVFDRDRVHIVLNEADIRARPEETVRAACRFLGIDDDIELPETEKKVHENRNSRLGVALARRVPFLSRPIRAIDQRLPGTSAPPYVPSEADRARMVERYRADEEPLAELIGRPEVRGWVT